MPPIAIPSSCVLPCRMYTAVKANPNAAATSSSAATSVSARRLPGTVRRARIDVGRRRSRAGQPRPRASCGGLLAATARSAASRATSDANRLAAFGSSGVIAILLHAVRSPISRATITIAASAKNQATIPSGIGPML